MGEQPLSVLITDDSLLVRKQLREILEGLGCNVSEAENGQKALEIIQTAKPDLVLLDIVMPDKGGIEALKDIKEFDSNIKVVMVSSVGTQSYLKEAIKLGAFDFMQKPVNAENLQRLIDKIQIGRCGT